MRSLGSAGRKTAALDLDRQDEAGMPSVGSAARGSTLSGTATENPNPCPIEPVESFEPI